MNGNENSDHSVARQFCKKAYSQQCTLGVLIKAATTHYYNFPPPSSIGSSAI